MLRRAKDQTRGAGGCCLLERTELPSEAISRWKTKNEMSAEMRLDVIQNDKL